jgi:hypothetical protein
MPRFGHLTGAMQQGAEKTEAVRALTLTLNAIARNSLRRKPSGLTIKSEEAQPQGAHHDRWFSGDHTGRWRQKPQVQEVEAFEEVEALEEALEEVPALLRAGCGRGATCARIFLVRPEKPFGGCRSGPCCRGGASPVFGSNDAALTKHYP